MTTPAPMPDARLAEIEALADQYCEKRVASQSALIDHDRHEVLRQESYANCLALVFTEEYGPELVAEVRRLRERAERDRVDLAHAWSDLLDVRGHLSPNGYPCRVPMEIHERVAPAVEWLLARVDALEAEAADLRADIAERIRLARKALTRRDADVDRLNARIARLNARIADTEAEHARLDAEKEA